VHWWLLLPYTQGNSNDFDALNLYLPLAQALLRDGLGFLATERSVQAPPFSYIFPALFGASMEAGRWVAFALSGATVLLLYGTAATAHSRPAGFAAALLFAFCPLLKPFLAGPITEPILLALQSLWIFALVRWMAGGPTAWAWVAGLAAALAALTRATSFYWLLALVAFFLVVWWRAPASGRPRLAAPLVAHAAAAALPLAFIIKNALLFGFPFFATGAGNALYLGNNPVTGGFDPTYVGLIYDVGAIAREHSHLSLAGERALSGVARLMISEMDAGTLLALHAKKLLAFVFVTNAEEGARWLRAWRIGLIVLGTIGAMSIAPRLRWLLAGTLACNLAVHIPVLYTHRYSAGSLDLWLILLAAFGIARMLQGSRRSLAAAAGVLLVGWALGAAASRYGGAPAPDAYAVPRVTVWKGTPAERALSGEEAVIDIAIAGAPLFQRLENNVLAIDASLDSPAGRCKPLRISFRKAGVSAPPASVDVRLRADGERRRLQVGWTKLGLNGEGSLRLALTCPPGGRLRIHAIAVAAPLGSLHYSERYLGEAPHFPLER
jgi:hypothetical protein